MKWHHGHSIGTGVAVGLLLSQHGWTIAVLAFVGGLAVGRGWGLIVSTFRTAARWYAGKASSSSSLRAPW